MHRAALLALIAFAPAAASAQHMSPPPIGTRVRATAFAPTAARQVGVVTGRSGDTLLVETPLGETVALPLATLRLLEVSDGQRTHTARGAAMGAVFGSVVGAGIGYAATNDQGLWAQLGAGVGFVLGLGGGALMGAMVGASVRTERWSAASGWELKLESSGPGLGLSLRF